MQSTKSSTMQSKINKIRDSVSKKLNKFSVEFVMSDIEVESEDKKQTVNGCRVVSNEISGCIVPNFNTLRPEFLILNQNMIDHLISEGFSDEEIIKTGKVWVHLKKADDFVKMFAKAKD